MFAMLLESIMLLKREVREYRFLIIIFLLLVVFIVLLLLWWKFPIPIYIHMINQNDIQVRIHSDDTEISLSEKQRQEIIHIIEDAKLRRTPYPSMKIAPYLTEITLDGNGLADDQRPMRFNILQNTPQKSYVQINDHFYSIQMQDVEVIQNFLRACSATLRI